MSLLSFNVEISKAIDSQEFIKICKNSKKFSTISKFIPCSSLAEKAMEIAGQAIDRQIEVMHQQQQKGEDFVRIHMNCKKNEGLVLIPKTST